MDDDLEPKDRESESEYNEEDIDESSDDIFPSTKKKGKISNDEDSLDALKAEEDEILPEDEFDDLEPDDRW